MAKNDEKNEEATHKKDEGSEGVPHVVFTMENWKKFDDRLQSSQKEYSGGFAGPSLTMSEFLKATSELRDSMEIRKI